MKLLVTCLRIQPINVGNLNFFSLQEGRPEVVEQVLHQVRAQIGVPRGCFTGFKNSNLTGYQNTGGAPIYFLVAG